MRISNNLLYILIRFYYYKLGLGALGAKYEKSIKYHTKKVQRSTSLNSM